MHSTRSRLNNRLKDTLLLTRNTKVPKQGLRLDGGAPVVRTGSTGNGVLPVNLAVSHGDLDKLGEVRLRRVLAVGHLAVDVNDGGIGQHGREEVLLLALNGGAVPLQGHFRQHLTGSQRVVHQRHGFVQRNGELERLVDTLTSRLTGLRVGRDGDNVLELLYQHLVFVTLHEDVADGIGGEGTGGDIALGFTFDADITWSWHVYAPK